MGNRYGLEIRAAAANDAPGLAALLAEAGVRVAAADLAGRIEAAQGRGGVLVAVEWGPPSGMVALQVVQALEEPRPSGLITTLLVGPEARRRGVGRVLLKAVARAARQAGCDRLLLPVRPGQADLCGFGAAAGFVQDGAVLVRPLLRRGGSDG